MTLNLEDTIVALSSAPGAGGRAVVRLSGSAALPCALRLFSSSESPSPGKRHVYAGSIRLAGIHAALPADLHFWPAPHTYTGQDLVELHMLSSPPLVDLLIAQLMAAGARAAQPGEFTMRAFLAGKMDLTRAEAILGVIEAADRHELQQALAQLAGGLSRPLQGLREDLLNLLADVEAGLDFAEEDIHFADPEQMLHRLAKALAQLTLVQKQLDQRAVNSTRLRVVFAGRPNAGKSSLFNALAAGSRALVSPTPGTTRDYLSGRLDLGDTQLEIIDTAGWQTPQDAIARQAQALGSQQFVQADLVVLCLDSGQPISAQERALLASAPPPEVVGVATKCDLQPAPSGLMATSAVTQIGLRELRYFLADWARAHRQPALAPSSSRCREHVRSCMEHLRSAHGLVLDEDSPELLALELRGALEGLGQMVGAVYTDDLLDRIFSRFCIGK
ncbi:MAG TPA: tRNA modification GTPase [Gemmataceae bacterium]|jgi:tRNA modification GTPase|nr:tRNA modification GTPase [Gemmataceae bacterium]